MIEVVNTTDVREIASLYFLGRITVTGAIGAIVQTGRTVRMARALLRAACYCQPPMTEPCRICRDLDGDAIG